ncbi:halocyanin domain-containing protein [Halalkalicoccus sp. NIPERK01]|uniref:halocyanin domain-containing protein n=1 Tax=Halalkalicoccus sp. NIPERK01 TaxID=3053469 RepID=UPI00256F184A|nr:halocyanin domain-containing protein [Halalkalicoccus sp. NIPERK01]MDL5363321.1 halocyanin domain-containing protein [Halalkalicoccus sp. NIPERK01]
MSTIEPCPNVGRRRFLTTAAALSVGGATLGTARPVSAQEAVDLTDWFADVSNYAGIVDERGAARVTVAVGAEGNGGGFAFGPAAVRVDPGTTVVWEWTGEGGAHNVVDEDGAYESDMVGDAGTTFEHAFETAGVSRYVCAPHEPMGMKGAVVVGDVAVATPAPTSEPDAEYEYVAREPDYGDWFDDVDNFEGTVDMRGREEVRIRVGVDGNGGGFALSPPAINVDPGTRVVWEWVGEDGPHWFAAADGSYASPEQSRGEYGLVFDGVGISKYACEPHEAAGMKGAVVVGDALEGVYDVTTTHLTVLGSLGAALLSPLAFGAFLWARGRREDDRRD